MSRHAIKNYVKDFLIKNNYNLNRRLPHKIRPMLAEMFWTSTDEIKYAIYTIRKELGEKVQKQVEIFPETKINDFQTYCVNNNILRDAANKERNACSKIVNALINVLPQGGIGMLIGTPTAFCATIKGNNNLLLTDNFEVALALKWTTDTPIKIIVGNAVDEKKAQLKAQHWKLNNSTNDSTVVLDKVDRNSYIGYITDLMAYEKLTKVVLLNSGVWKCCKTTKRKYNGLDFNFKSPSIHLTALYPNLHILAITRETKGFDFSVRYLNNGKNELI